jgi:hypothetical protein
MFWLVLASGDAGWATASLGQNVVLPQFPGTETRWGNCVTLQRTSRNSPEAFRALGIRHGLALFLGVWRDEESPRYLRGENPMGF